MGYTFKFVAPSGYEWWLMARNPNGVFINEGSLSSQLVGSLKETATSFVGSPGQMVSSQDSQFAPITGTLQCTVAAEYCDDRPDVVWRRFRSDWEDTTPENPGALVMDRGDGDGELWLPARLNGALSGSGMNPSELDEIPISVPVVGDRGQWLLPEHGEGNVTVMNLGQGFVCPKIRWFGAGGVVELPSGAEVMLPAVMEPRILSLDYATSFEVVDDEGVHDDVLWRQLRGQVLGEGIPVGASRTYSLPPDAALIWELAFLNPWR